MSSLSSSSSFGELYDYVSRLNSAGIAIGLLNIALEGVENVTKPCGSSKNMKLLTPCGAKIARTEAEALVSLNDNVAREQFCSLANVDRHGRIRGAAIKIYADSDFFSIDIDQCNEFSENLRVQCERSC
jgi:hypothetical protein